jgi:hypothetical protein
LQQAAGGVFGERIVEGSKEAVGAVAESELLFWIGAGEAEEELARVHADAGEFFSNAVSRVEGDRHSLLL